ncbi:AAA family ATPase [Cetobacterium sp.]|uniref:AAA family ATPase n=1 Tax=Cetobacterium sp. TaxID=2071632 RepID=UPI003F29FB50
MKRKKLPIGKSDFKSLREENYYYIDKTEFIEEILEKRTEVTLICRPRRFGKTLNMSTLKYFLDIENAAKNRSLFSGLNIEKTEHINEQGKYPVIFLTMKGISGDNFSQFLQKFSSELGNLYNKYEFFRDKMNKRELAYFDKIWLEVPDTDFSSALRFLSDILYKHYNIKPVLLIDEYDSPMIASHEKGYYDKAKELIGNFYGSALKDAPISFAVVTGILRVAKESIFSSLNNLKVSTLLSSDYNYFGMTETEVESVLKYYKLETTIESAKNWYNGYTFGNEKMYNPWSILNHCDSGKLESYWVNSSANTLIMQLLKDSDTSIKDIFYELLRGGKAKAILDDNMIFGERYSDSTILYLMFSAGYLTIENTGEDEDQYYLRIPNLEVKKYFRKTFIELLTNNSRDSFSQLKTALKDGKICGNNSVEEKINSMFEASMSYFDGSKEEKFYHNLILGMMIGLDSSFYIHSNREEGLGRYDLALEPKNKNGIGYIFEFKVANSNSKSDLDFAGTHALDQINEKCYEQGLKQRGIEKIIKIGMVFSSKVMKLYIR